MSFRAEFFAPTTVTSPANRAPPCTRIRSVVDTVTAAIVGSGATLCAPERDSDPSGEPAPLITIAALTPSVSWVTVSPSPWFAYPGRHGCAPHPHLHPHRRRRHDRVG